MKKWEIIFHTPLLFALVGLYITATGKKGIVPLTPYSSIFESYAASLLLFFLLWYLYRFWPIETRKTSRRTDFIPLRTILLYQRSFFIIPKVPSAWMDRFILSSAPWMLSRFSITSLCIPVSSSFMRTVLFLSVLQILHG